MAKIFFFFLALLRGFLFYPKVFQAFPFFHNRSRHVCRFQPPKRALDPAPPPVPWQGALLGADNLGSHQARR